MRPDPCQGIIPREHRDGVRDGPPPPPIVLIDPDPDVTSRWSVVGELLGCFRVLVVCLLVAGVCVVAVAALMVLARHAPTMIGLVLLAMAGVAVGQVVADCIRDADPSGERSPHWVNTLLRMALAAALVIAVMLAWMLA